MYMKGNEPFGYSLHCETQQKIERLRKKHECHFTWVQEVVAEAKRTFSSPEIQLLPKTPSVKRTRQMAKADSEEDDPKAKKRPKRSRKAKKTEDTDSETGPDSSNSTRSSRATRSTRSTRSTRTNDIKDQAKKNSPRLRLDSARLRLCDEENNSSALVTVNEVSIIPEEDIAEVAPSPKPRTPIQPKHELASPKAVASPASPVKANKPSPKPIPGFTGLNVKAKATAYEEFVSSPQKPTAVAAALDEVPSPKPRNALCRVLDSLRKSNSPRKQVSPIKGTPTENSSPGPAMSKGATTITPTGEPVHVEMPVKKETEVAEEHRRSRKSIRRSSHVVSKPSGVHRTSLSKRRSSLMRHKLRQSNTSSLNRSSSIRRTPSKARKPTPAPITLGDGPVTQVPEPGHEKPDFQEEEQKPIDLPVTDTPKSTKKQRHMPQNNDNESDADVETEEEPIESKTPVPLPRTTRSKMRLKKSPPKLPVGSSEDESAPQPTRSTRSKMRLNKAAPPKLPVGSSDDDGSEPKRTTRSKMRDNNKPAVDSPSLKRPGQDIPVEPSPQKKCVDRAGSQSDDQSEGIVYKTPSPPCPKNKVIRGQGHLPTSSFLSHLKKTVNTPSNLCSTLSSFIKRNTPLKSSTTQERELQKRREVEAKKEATEQRLNKRQELLHQRAEEQRRRREERQALAAKRREENQRRQVESRNEVQQKHDEKKDIKARMQEEKLREERERQKMKEKKLAVAELKRKQEEEIRLQKVREAEAEARRQEEALQRKREYEEAERQKRLADQRRQEEERRQEAVRERQLEIERLHREVLEKQKRDAEERHQREEELKRQRQEREKRELEEKKERERIRMAELDKIREKERLRLQAEAQAAADRKEEERRAQEAIQKHNNSVLKQNTSLMNSSNLQSSSSHHTTQVSAKPALNTTITKEINPDSYEMTPVKKQKKQKNPNNYDIEDLHSDDSTDDEEAPKRPTPAWAAGSNLKAAMINQHYHPPDLDAIFPMIEMPDLNLVFKRKKPRFNKRTSSACWDSPILKHSAPLY